MSDGAPPQMTKEEAQTRIEALVRDPAAAALRMTRGEAGRAAREEWRALHEAAVVSTPSAAPQGDASTVLGELRERLRAERLGVRR